MSDILRPVGFTWSQYVTEDVVADSLEEYRDSPSRILNRLRKMVRAMSVEKGWDARGVLCGTAAGDYVSTNWEVCSKCHTDGLVGCNRAFCPSCGPARLAPRAREQYAFMIEGHEMDRDSYMVTFTFQHHLGMDEKAVFDALNRCVSKLCARRWWRSSGLEGYANLDATFGGPDGAHPHWNLIIRGTSDDLKTFRTNIEATWLDILQTEGLSAAAGVAVDMKLVYSDPTGDEFGALQAAEYVTKACLETTSLHTKVSDPADVRKNGISGGLTMVELGVVAAVTGIPELVEAYAYYLYNFMHGVKTIRRLSTQRMTEEIMDDYCGVLDAARSEIPVGEKCLISTPAVLLDDSCEAIGRVEDVLNRNTFQVYAADKDPDADMSSVVALSWSQAIDVVRGAFDVYAPGVPIQVGGPALPDVVVVSPGSAPIGPRWEFDGESVPVPRSYRSAAEQVALVESAHLQLLLDTVRADYSSVRRPGETLAEQCTRIEEHQLTVNMLRRKIAQLEKCHTV